VHIKKGEANFHQNCDIKIDQIRAIDNNRLVKKVGDLPKNLINSFKENLMIIIDLE
jgi:mRNA interferase MazF